MAIFKTNFEVIPASEKEMASYYEEAAKQINMLLEKYNIRNAKGQLEEVSADKLQALLSYTGFFQATPLKSIFLDQKQQFVPQEIIQTFRSIISKPPVNIKAVFFDTFMMLLTEKGWDKALSTYFEKQYDFPPEGIIILESLEDFSLAFGVYKVTFQLRTPRREKVIVFLKKSHGMHSYNELLYFHLQKKLLPTTCYASMPCRLVDKENKEALLLSPLIPGFASDTILSLLMQTYKKIKNHDCEFILRKTLEIFIEAFINHAVLGDILGRNDRHLMNSLIAFVAEEGLQKPTLEDLNDFEKFLAYAKKIVTEKMNVISLIAIDLKWLLEEKNIAWILIDIDFGLSELNLLSLLPEFNDYHAKKNPFFEKRKEYITHYFNLYCKNQKAILEKKDLIFSTIKAIYPANISEEKLKFLMHNINFLDKNKEFTVALFERYLFNFRLRLVHKETLIALVKTAKETNNVNFLSALKEADLLKYLPSQPDLSTYESSVLLRLQCFRGVLTRKDMAILSQEDRTAWETVASNIAMIAEKFASDLFNDLEDKKEFIKKDSARLLDSIYPSQTIPSNFLYRKV